MPKSALTPCILGLMLVFTLLHLIGGATDSWEAWLDGSLSVICSFVLYRLLNRGKVDPEW